MMKQWTENEEAGAKKEERKLKVGMEERRSLRRKVWEEANEKGW
jgi:hypothetical protein